MLLVNVGLINGQPLIIMKSTYFYITLTLALKLILHYLTNTLIMKLVQCMFNSYKRFRLSLVPEEYD